MAAVLSSLLPFSLVFLSGCLMFFLDLGKYPLFNPDEALYAEPAREMLETGEYVTTLLNYVVRYTKPPLVIWAMAFSYKIFGVNEFAARFFGAAAGAILVAGCYWFLAKYAGRRPAIFGSLALCTAPLFVGAAREAITDMPLSLFLAGSLLSFYHSFEQKSSFWRWTAWAAVGLSVMTKGPVGLILPVSIMAVFHLLRGQTRQALSFYKPHLGLLIVCLIAVPWFALEIYLTKGAYYYEFIVRENFQRFTSVVDHKGAWWYHIAAMAGGFFPWTVFLPLAFARALNLPRLSGAAVWPKHSPLPQNSGNRQGVNLPGWLKHYHKLEPQQSLLLFCAAWAAIVLAFFSASVSKLIPYTLPAFPALAALVGVELDYLIKGRNNRRLALPLLLIALIYGGALLALPLAVSKLREAPAGLVALGQALLSFQLVAALLSAGVAAGKREQRGALLFIVLTLFSSLYFGGRALPLLSEEWEGPLPDFARYAALSSWTVLVFDMRKPSVPFYAKRAVILPSDRADLERRLSSLAGAYILSRSRNRQYLEALPGCRTVAVRGQFILVCCQPTARPSSLR